MGTTEDFQCLHERALLSYIDRNIGVCSAMGHDWEGALPKFKAAITILPTNATAYYLLGCYHQDKENHDDAIKCMLTSIALDPDFKAPYLALSNSHLMNRSFEMAIACSAACLSRNPDAPYAQFIIGQSIYHMLFGPKAAAASSMCEKAIAALRIAKERERGQWSNSDEKMLEFLKDSPCR